MVFDISSFGAAADTLCTTAIQKAIDACSAAGGGEVVVPAGKFLTGTLRLKSGVNLHLSAGAVLLGSPHLEHYPADVHHNMYVNESHLDRCLIYARGASNIAITGRGVIDGNGTAFPNADDGDRHRPMLVRLAECEEVLMRDVRLINPASWGLAALYSRDICVDNVQVQSRSSEVGDGLDFDGCRDVRISNCKVDAGNDGICLQASRTDRTCVDVAIYNCLISAKNTGIRVGLLSVGTIRDVAVDNCVLHDIEDSAVKVQVSEGGIVENVRFGQLVLREALRIAFISLSRHRTCRDTPPGIPPMGAVRGISISGVQMHTTRASDRRAAAIICGSRDGKIEDISLRDIDALVPGGEEKFEGRIADVRELGASRPEPRALGNVLPAHGLYARHVRGLHLEGLRFRPDLPDARPAQVLDDVTAG